MAAIVQDKGTPMSQLERDSWTVCLVAHNGKATDFDWIGHLNTRYDVSLPSFVVWCWDTLPAIKLLPQYKVTREMKKNGVAAPAGNHDHGLAELHKAITGEDHEGHHDAGADAIANVGIAKILYSKRFNKTGGMVTWADCEIEGEGGEGCRAAAAA